ncbi:hypothetical protein SCB49_02774 [unidentified eubacterium SCB49]|nr:hypothetical protein SCB49_02774 [unidentified eubacterium SCB49]
MNINRPKKLDYIFVSIQLLLFVIYALPIKFFTIAVPVWIQYSGIFLVVLGVLLGAVALLQINTKLSPFPTPVSNSTLLSTGAFSIARHPIYTAILMVSFGYAIYQESIFKLLIFFALFVLFYFKSKYEEKMLLLTFDSYKEYIKRTGRFFPKLF